MRSSRCRINRRRFRPVRSGNAFEDTVARLLQTIRLGIVEPGGVLPLYYFERDLVLWRDSDGAYHLQDAICPHLGGHLGHGGHVEKCEIMCPFHGWKFDAVGYTDSFFDVWLSD